MTTYFLCTTIINRIQGSRKFDSVDRPALKNNVLDSLYQYFDTFKCSALVNEERNTTHTSENKHEFIRCYHNNNNNNNNNNRYLYSAHVLCSRNYVEK